VTGRPWRNRREIVQTSVVDAAPERIVALPGPSYWPLVAATTLAVAIVGVLVDWWVLSGAGAAGLVASLIGWNESNRRASSQELSRIDPDDPQLHERHEADAVFSEYVSVGRSAVWWASLLAAAALATITGAMIYAYGYLWLSADQWPLGGQDPRDLGGPLLALGLVVAAWLVAPTTNLHRLTAAVSALVATAAVVVQVTAVVQSDVSISADAYQALVITLEGWSAVILGSAVAVRVAAVALMGPDRSVPSLRDADRAFFTSAVLIWAALWITLHVGARWL
jgi:cytochrome c oxidase subunit I+III